MIAERYANKLYPYDPSVIVARWWAHPRILVGGSIIDEADWKHLRDDYGIAGVLNVETEHDDSGKKIPVLCQAQFADDGKPDPKVLYTGLKFARGFLAVDPLKLDAPGMKLYVHCQMGGSRSPAVAYMILRDVFRMTPGAAVQAIRNGKEDPKWGEHPVHIGYATTIDQLLMQVDHENLT